MFKLRVRYPAIEELNAILDRTTQAHAAAVERVLDAPAVLRFREVVREVPIASHVRDFATRLVMATHPQWEHAPAATRSYVRYGASPRGAQALVLGAKVRALTEGRYNVSMDDIRALAAPALRHRVILNFAGESEAIDPDTLIAELVQTAHAAAARTVEPVLR
jgi:MoxR-like ATPase